MRRIKSFEGVEMREKRKRILVVFFTVYTVLSANAQGQGTTTGLTVGKFADIGQMLGAFSKNNAGRLNISADMGLNWSDSYIGELIHIPPHFGFGLSLVMNGVKNDNFNRLLSETLGTPAIDAWFAQKQFFPNYLIECRIGGFRDLPFDIGLKVGYIPTVSFIFSDYGYNNLQFGGDIRYNFLSSYSGLKMSMSVGVGYVNGYFSKSDYNISWSPTGQASPVTNAGALGYAFFQPEIPYRQDLPGRRLYDFRLRGHRLRGNVHRPSADRRERDVGRAGDKQSKSVDRVEEHSGYAEQPSCQWFPMEYRGRRRQQDFDSRRY